MDSAQITVKKTFIEVSYEGAIFDSASGLPRRANSDPVLFRDPSADASMAEWRPTEEPVEFEITGFCDTDDEEENHAALPCYRSIEDTSSQGEDGHGKSSCGSECMDPPKDDNVILGVGIISTEAAAGTPRKRQGESSSNEVIAKLLSDNESLAHENQALRDGLSGFYQERVHCGSEAFATPQYVAMWLPVDMFMDPMQQRHFDPFSRKTEHPCDGAHTEVYRMAMAVIA